jgi:hypothetical protein
VSRHRACLSRFCDPGVAGREQALAQRIEFVLVEAAAMRAR